MTLTVLNVLSRHVFEKMGRILVTTKLQTQFLNAVMYGYLKIKT